MLYYVFFPLRRKTETIYLNTFSAVFKYISRIIRSRINLNVHACGRQWSVANFIEVNCNTREVHRRRFKNNNLK